MRWSPGQSAIIGAAAIWLAAAAPALAAPQILGLVASASATPLTCDAAGCRAELSSFCLQQPRPNPAPQTVYRPVAGAQLFLVGTDLEGAAVRFPAAPHLVFTSARGFTAVEVAIPAETMRELGLRAAAIEVGRDVSLVPAVGASDPDPQSADEIEAATGRVRQAAAPFFDAPGEAADGIRLTNSMINALPATGRTQSDGDGHLLDAARGAGTADPAGIALARFVHAACVAKVDVTHHIFSMRDCLESSHDRLVIRTNLEFWESLGGS